MKQAKDKSSICDVDDDDDDDDDHSLVSSMPLKPVSQKPTSKRTGSKQKATDDAQVNDDGSLGSSSTSLKPIPQKHSSKCTGKKRKATDDAHDDARTGLYRVMTQRMKDKQKSPRLKFFESIMPQVDELIDDWVFFFFWTSRWKFCAH